MGVYTVGMPVVVSVVAVRAGACDQVDTAAQVHDFRLIPDFAQQAGAYISMGGLFSIVIGYGFPSMAPAPGLQRLLSGLVFPLGLMLVVFAGAELFTGNNAVLIPGALGRRYGWRKVLLNWMLVYAGNFVGSLFFACFLVKLPGMLSAEAWRSAAVGIAEAKVSMPWLTVFLRGVGANWLVCLAVWLGLSANDVAGRLLGLFFPIM